MNTILIIWCDNEDEDEGETDCHMNCDKGSYSVMKYDTTKCIMHLRTWTHSYLVKNREHIEQTTLST